MLVRNWMTKEVVTIDVDETMERAMGIIKLKKIRMLPVVKKGRLVGVVTDRDIRSSSASKATSLEVHELIYLLSKIKVREIMTRNPVTVPPDYTIEETAEILLHNKINGVPVVDDQGGIMGVITQTDIFRTFISLTGLSKRGILAAFELEDRPGSIKDVTDLIRNYGGRISSILSSYDKAGEGYRNVYIRMHGVERPLSDFLKKDLKKRATMLYWADHKQGIREICR